jgi:hypothetical protein
MNLWGMCEGLIHRMPKYMTESQFQPWVRVLSKLENPAHPLAGSYPTKQVNLWNEGYQRGTWLMDSIAGQARLTPYQRGTLESCIRLADRKF